VEKRKNRREKDGAVRIRASSGKKSYVFFGKLVEALEVGDLSRHERGGDVALGRKIRVDLQNLSWVASIMPSSGNYHGREKKGEKGGNRNLKHSGL